MSFIEIFEYTLDFLVYNFARIFIKNSVIGKSWYVINTYMIVNKINNQKICTGNDEMSNCGIFICV